MKVTQIKSKNGANHAQRETLRSLGLRKIGHTVEVKDNDDFLTLGIVDSLGFVELVEEVQSRYGVTVEDVEITEDNFGSIDAIGDYVERKRKVA